MSENCADLATKEDIAALQQKINELDSRIQQLENLEARLKEVEDAIAAGIDITDAINTYLGIS